MRMPPAEEHAEPLAPDEIALLTRWVQEGAPWERHWAFVKPRKPVLPAVADASWATQELDRFILARLEAEGLQPSPAAQPAAWLRRVSWI